MQERYMDHQKKIRHCFNKAADTYDLHSSAQQEIGKELITHLSNEHLSRSVIPAQAGIQSLHHPHIIDLGCGSGTTTQQLLEMLHHKNYLYQKCYAIDISERLLMHAQQKLAAFPTTVVSEQDFDALHYPHILFDLVFSNMALHWSSNLGKVLAAIRKQLSDHGLLAFSIPLAGTFPELTGSHKNTFYTMDTMQKLLENSGFIPLKVHSKNFTVYYSSAIEALKSLKKSGANYLFSQTSKSLSGKSSIPKLISTTHHHKDIFSLTYHIGFFIFRKK